MFLTTTSNRAPSLAMGRSSVISMAMLACCISVAAAQERTDTSWKSDYSFQFGIDAWDIHSSIAGDVFNGPYPQDWNISHSILGLPNSATVWNYQSPSAWYKFQGSVSPTDQLRLSTKVQANQQTGFRLDELSADYALSPYLGFRAGIVDYKLSWCSMYDVHSPWIAEPNMFCGVRYTSVVTGGAPGVQTYFNNKYGDYRVQFLAGAYKANLFNYDTREFGDYNLDGSPQRDTLNNKLGLSANILDVNTGNQFRFSWVHSQQHAASVTLTTADLTADTLYAGLEINLRNDLSFKLTRTDYFGSVSIQDQFDPADSWNGVISNTSFSNSTAELRYIPDQQNTFALAYSLYQAGIDNKNLPAALVESSGIYSDGYFRLNRQQTAVSWRHDWDSSLFSVVQASYTDLSSGYDGARYKSNAWTVGLRVGYTF